MNSLLPAVIHIDKIPPVAFAAFFLFIVVIASTFGILLLLNRKYRFVANIDAVTGLYTNWKFCIEARKMLARHPLKQFVLFTIEIKRLLFFNNLIGRSKTDARIYGTRHTWNLELTMPMIKLEDRWIIQKAVAKSY